MQFIDVTAGPPERRLRPGDGAPAHGRRSHGRAHLLSGVELGPQRHVLATTSGRLRRITCWVPLEKAQSLRHVQGPVQRRLSLASVHVDTAGRAVHATLRDRDAAEAAYALEELTARTRREGSAGARISGRGP
jgi:hypothetical protein